MANAANNEAPRGSLPGEPSSSRPTEPLSVAATLPLNPTGRAIDLTVPVLDGTRYMGDIELRLMPDDEIRLPAQRLLDLVVVSAKPDLAAKLRTMLAAQATIGLDALAPLGIRMRYDPQKIALVLDIPAELEAQRTIQVASLGVETVGGFARPAGFSAYLTMRGAVDYVEAGTNRGLGTPSMFLDGAARLAGVVFETQGVFQPGGNGPALQRQGSRFVYDDQDRLIRWTAGDLRTVARGFQYAPDIAGISILRSYSALQPQTITRPTGRQSFRLDQPSTVEIWVNDQLVRRTRLDPGSYDLRDFPYTQGIDNARITIRGDGGRVETLNFSLFSDQSQLAAGLSEFGLYAGVKAPPGRSGPVYSSEPVITGFYRRGLSERLTLGGNLQADRHSRMIGVESILATPIGAFGMNLAASQIDGRGAGGAALFTFRSLIQRKDMTSDALDLSAELLSKNFAPSGDVFGQNPFTYRLSGGYSHAFSQAIYAGVDVNYAKGRAGVWDSSAYRMTIGWRPVPRMNFTATTVYEGATRSRRAGLSFLLSLTVQMGKGASLIADYDSGHQTERISYQAQYGQGVGSLNLSGSLERSPHNVGINGSANYITSAGEIGIDQLTSFEGGAGSPTDSRTNLRFATSIAFADGAVSIGRPISDSFAIVSRRENIRHARVELEPGPYGYTAGTTPLGTATQPDLMSYNNRTITIDAPGAPADLDLGPGAFRVFPPYRSGYRLQAGSEYPVTLVGRLLDEEGKPLALLSGLATELAAPEREPLPVFTSSDGRFAVTGLKPGHWRIAFHTDPITVYTVDIPPGKTTGVFKMEDIRPEKADGRP
ncbi:fimbria/pilus outer membrane usher protein [Sphingomonas oligophenolica]|uniref:Fimbria/pilus outer membrane usher protein n=1 Tax=Sphingomonas oligophenolica TaxID=301154 RepID=A0ABU9Y9R2_9SPHN